MMPVSYMFICSCKARSSGDYNNSISREQSPWETRLRLCLRVEQGVVVKIQVFERCSTYIANIFGPVYAPLAERHLIYYWLAPMGGEFDRKRYIKRVNEVLELCSGNKLNSFKVAFFLDQKDTEDLDKWVRFAITKGAQKLDLRCYGTLSACDKYVFPHWILADLNSIKIFLEHLFSACLLLESLTLISCAVHSNLIIGPSLHLHDLKVLACYVFGRLEIDAVNLSSLEYDGYNTQISFMKTPKLVTIFFKGLQGPLPNVLTQLTSCPELSTLHLQIREYFEHIPQTFPTLRNLKKLKLDLLLADLELGSVLNILRTAPLLEELLITVSYQCYWESLLWYWLTSDNPIQAILSSNSLELCINLSQTMYSVLHQRALEYHGEIRNLCTFSHNHLRRVKMQGFQGMWFEIEFAICIVKIATKLESMVIDPHGSFYDGDGTWYNITCSYGEGNEDEHPEEEIEGISKDENVNVPYKLLFCLILIGTTGGYFLGRARGRKAALVDQQQDDVASVADLLENNVQPPPAAAVVSLSKDEQKAIISRKSNFSSPSRPNKKNTFSLYQQNPSRLYCAEFGCKLCIGPCTTKQEGFYYDAYYGGLGLNDEHLKKIEALAKKAVEAKHCFERIEVSVEQAFEIFSDNKFKVEIINELHADNKAITVYRCGDLVDLCPGPHIPNTSFVKAFRCLKASSAYWRGNKHSESLQRVYGISYPDENSLKAYYQAAGRIKKSHYKENMFLLDIEEEEYGVKPMNCPGHCEVFRHRPRSYRELPLRIAEFGVLHRNEASGALEGLTRVRRFVQDDAHIFCRESQLKDELKGVLDFIKYTYDIVGLSFDVELSTRPESYHGGRATWDKVKAILTEALNEFGMPWQINEGDGAFYGPKIDFSVCNALKKKFQCATIQLDFQLPDHAQFDLHYTSDKQGKGEKPVMIHRAVFGSFERFIGILLEHYKGKWPFWLSPRQVIVCSVTQEFEAYAVQVQQRIRRNGYHVDVDISDRSVSKKIREAQVAQYNYVLVVGDKEDKSDQVSV
ncbi:hypothetical protein ACLB2K_067803 [Fragaria x ananassa]